MWKPPTYVSELQETTREVYGQKLNGNPHHYLIQPGNSGNKSGKASRRLGRRKRVEDLPDELTNVDKYAKNRNSLETL